MGSNHRSKFQIRVTSANPRPLNELLSISWHFLVMVVPVDGDSVSCDGDLHVVSKDIL